MTGANTDLMPSNNVEKRRDGSYRAKDQHSERKIRQKTHYLPTIELLMTWHP